MIIIQFSIIILSTATAKARELTMCVGISSVDEIIIMIIIWNSFDVFFCINIRNNKVSLSFVIESETTQKHNRGNRETYSLA